MENIIVFVQYKENIRCGRLQLKILMVGRILFQEGPRAVENGLLQWRLWRRSVCLFGPFLVIYPDQVLEILSYQLQVNAQSPDIKANMMLLCCMQKKKTNKKNCKQKCVTTLKSRLKKKHAFEATVSDSVNSSNISHSLPRIKNICFLILLKCLPTCVNAPFVFKQPSLETRQTNASLFVVFTMMCQH